MSDQVLVTGATGFIAQHCIVQLLEAGFRVRGTARTEGRTREVADILAPHLSEDARSRLASNFEVVRADLLDDARWREAAEGCRFVLHVASPIPRTPATSDDELIVPARDGALRVLRAAREAGVERVVLTSSVAAVVYGHPQVKLFDESDWTDVNGPRVGAYEKSKTIAERAAWDFMGSLEDDSMQLVTILPGLVLGPLLSSDWGTSGEVVKKILDRDIPAIPDINFAVVDVRDVAAAHVTAMESPGAAGQRYLCAIENHPMVEVATILKRHCGPLGFKVTTRRLPTPLFRLVALWDKTARLALNEVGTLKEVDSSKIRTELHWSPRDINDMTESMADSMIRYGVVSAKQ